MNTQLKLIEKKHVIYPMELPFNTKTTEAAKNLLKQVAIVKYLRLWNRYNHRRIYVCLCEDFDSSYFDFSTCKFYIGKKGEDFLLDIDDTEQLDLFLEGYPFQDISRGRFEYGVDQLKKVLKLLREYIRCANAKNKPKPVLKLVVNN